MNRLNQGFTLIETMVAIAVAAVLGTALIGMTLQSQGISNTAKLKSQAGHYAEQLVEQVRSYRNQIPIWETFRDTVSLNNFQMRCWPDATFAVGSVTWVTTSGTCDSPSHPPQTISGTPFGQWIGVIQVNSDVVRVDAFIFYKDRGVSKTEIITSYLSKR